MVHTQFEHHLMERVEAMSAKVADVTKSYQELKLQGEQVSENLAAIEAQVGIGRQELDIYTERARYLSERDELSDKLQASNEAKLKAQFAEGVALTNQALEKEAFEKKVLEAPKEAQHSQNELVRCRAQANTACAELEDLKLRFNDLGGPNVYSENRQQAEDNLETNLQEARDELAEMTSTLDDARRYLKEAKSRLGDDLEQLEAKVEKLEGENRALVERAEASEKASD